MKNYTKCSTIRHIVVEFLDIKNKDTIEYYMAKRKKERLPFTKAWMELESIKAYKKNRDIFLSLAGLFHLA